MTPKELEAIKDRAEKSRMWESAGHLMSWCEQDRAALLDEVDRLRALHQGQADHITVLRTEVDTLLTMVDRLPGGDQELRRTGRR